MLNMGKRVKKAAHPDTAIGLRLRRAWGGGVVPFTLAVARAKE